jgi:hypothetical protein
MLFASFWGVFGWMEMLPGPALLLLYLALSTIAVFGLLRSLLAYRTPGRAAGSGEPLLQFPLLVSCIAAVVLGVLAVVFYALFDYQPQGRYLFPVSAPVALLVAVGWRQASRRLGVVLAAAALLALGLANLQSLFYEIPWYLQQ